MKIIQTSIPEVKIIQPGVFEDARGFFLESYHKQKYADIGVIDEFIQDNHSRSVKNVLRGLHYQISRPQGKLVRVVVGEVYDVAVDIRKSSPTFCKWVGVTLSAVEKNQIWIPRGFAHGFLTLSDWAEVLYKATDTYDPDAERYLLWNDPDIGIVWPLPQDTRPLLSTKDMKALPLGMAELFP
jgi:dTDP-4-dehydrorhamnose 3,5-epimerase